MLYLNDPGKYPKAAAYVAALNEQYKEVRDMLFDDLTGEQWEAIERCYCDKREKIITAAHLLYTLNMGGAKDPTDGSEFGFWEPNCTV